MASPVTPVSVQGTSRDSPTYDRRSVEDRRKRSLTADDTEEDRNNKKQKGDKLVHLEQTVAKTRSAGGSRTIDDVFDAITTLTARFDQRMNDMEERMFGKMKSMLEAEITEVREEMTDKITDVGHHLTQLQNEHNSLRERVDRQSQDAGSNSSSSAHSIHLNIVIRNLGESRNENVNSKVNGLIKDGLKLNGIQIDSAERKESNGSRYPGVVIAKCKTFDDKRAILENKNKLKHSRNFDRVYINSDKPLQQRIFESNMKVLADTVGGLKLSGGRIQRVGGGRHQHPQDRWDQRDDRRQRGGRDASPRTWRDRNNEARGYVDKHSRPRDMRPTIEEREAGRQRYEVTDARGSVDIQEPRDHQAAANEDRGRREVGGHHNRRVLHTRQYSR